MQWVVMVHQKRLLMVFQIITKIQKYFYRIFGDKSNKKFNSKNIKQNIFEIIHTKNFVKGTDTPLEAAKRGKDTSMWLAIEEC